MFIKIKDETEMRFMTSLILKTTQPSSVFQLTSNPD
jgi:hypothetical protein